mmetsp:Transcript_5430/g.7259  ORF Transcript_5430/g.7259 Transcript_5430/m.7259 type:complete len:87 (+) Transcript_5430:471-731(+)
MGHRKTKVIVSEMKQHFKMNMLKTFIESEANTRKGLPLTPNVAPGAPTGLAQRSSNMKVDDDNKTVSQTVYQTEVQKKVNENFKNF